MKIYKHHGSYNIQTRTKPIKYIVIHYVGAGASKSGNAEANCKYFAGSNRNASAHYFVDDGGIWEYANPKAYVTWHCGDGHGAYGITNANSIGVEVCINGDKAYTTKEINFLKQLIPYLMKTYGVSASNVVRHYDASRKMCPYYYAKRNDVWIKLRSQITSSKTGWYKELGIWHYYENGAMIKKAWRKDSKGWCYLDSNGRVTTNGWAKDSKGWCYLGSNGYMVASKWIRYKNQWYYLKSDGYMMSSAWLKYKNQWYYLKADGAMAANEWIKYKNNWYYLKATGEMVTGAFTIDGKVNKFDSSGKWLG